jgi:hypothetical protein
MCSRAHVAVQNEVLMRALTLAHTTRSTDQVSMRSGVRLIWCVKRAPAQRQMEKGYAFRVWQREEGLKARMG